MKVLRDQTSGAAVFALLAIMAGASGARAQVAKGDGLSQPWQLGLQDPATPIMQSIFDFHNFLLVIITVITLFVLGLLAYCAVRFNAKANPTPSRTTHNTTIEILWTVIPIIILLVIAVPSFRLLYFQRDIPEADMTIKATGNQWYWSYEYPDAENVSFDSVMVEDEDLKPGQPRLLTVDNNIVVPVDKTVRVLVTASDVIHDFAMPAFGLKMDAVPGRINETWFRAQKTGLFHGQCSELCGVRHAFMPITIEVVTQAEYDQWLQQQSAAAPGGDTGTRLAATAPVARD